MLRIRDNVAGEPVVFNYVNHRADLNEVAEFVRSRQALGIDTESTGLNPYVPGWELRTTQVGDDSYSFVVPARERNREFIAWLMRRDIKWIGHNGPHDIRCIDQYLGYETDVVCAGETYIPAHHMDSRNQQEGGTGHGLKELSIAYIDRTAGKWEVELKRVFKTIEVPMPGQVYKSGKRKGQPRVRKARLAEGWALIDPTHPAYIAYAASDPLLTYRLWCYLQPWVREFYDLYKFDLGVQIAGDRLTRRAMRLDVEYTTKVGDAFTRKAERMMAIARGYGCNNIHSGAQIATTLINLGAQLTERTPTGAFKTDDFVLRKLLGYDGPSDVSSFIRSVLVAKQLLKRRAAYTEAMLREMDNNGRIHPSINTMGARTTRMSVSRPALQQLPTKDRDDEE